MLRVEGAIVIRRPVDEVFDFVADARNLYDPRIVGAEKVWRLALIYGRG